MIFASCVSWRALALLIPGLLLSSRAAADAADLLGDREVLEQKVNEIVHPFLQQVPAKSPDKPEKDVENQNGAQDKPETAAQNGRAWAIVVGIVSKQGRHVFGHGRVAADSPARPDGRTLFEIGSVTKTFTALLLADSAERGKLKLDDPVRLYLPDEVKMPKRGDKEITLEHLATHTSALPRIPLSMRFTAIFDTNPYKNFDADDLYKTLTRVSLARDPGEKYEYSNLAFGLLGHALSRQEGCSYEDLVVKRICEPLGLRDTRATLDEDQRRRFALPYTASGTKASRWEFDAIAGAGALRSTADDMLTYVEANMGLKKTELLPAMRRCHKTRHPTPSKTQSIGLGWHVEKWSGDSQLIFHGGGTGGYNCLVGFVEEDGEPTIGLVVLTNAAPAASGMVGNDVAVKVLRELRKKST
jgi:CubicO group peptidase (beta-lactamase class C family)